MKLTRKSVIVAAAIVIGAGAVGAVGGLPAGWLVALLAALIVLVIIVLRDGETSHNAADMIQPDPRPETPSAPQPPSSRAVYDARVPSAAAEYEFSFSCTTYWTAVGLPSRRDDLGELAITTMLKRARRVLALVEPTEEAVAKHEVTNALQLAQPDETQQIRVWADNIQVRLPEVYMRRAEQRAELRRQQEIADLERQLEKDFRAYLSEDALATPGTATVWWLSKNPTEIEQCVELYQTLRTLSDAANDRIRPDSASDRFLDTPSDGQFAGDSAAGWSEQPGIRWPMTDDGAARTVLFAVPERAGESEPASRPSFAEAVEALLDGLDPAERKLKAFELANLEETFNHPTRAQQIRASYDVARIGQDTGEDRPTATDLPPATTYQPTPAAQTVPIMPLGRSASPRSPDSTEPEDRTGLESAIEPSTAVMPPTATADANVAAPASAPHHSDSRRADLADTTGDSIGTATSDESAVTDARQQTAQPAEPVLPMQTEPTIGNQIVAGPGPGQSEKQTGYREQFYTPGDDAESPSAPRGATES